MRPPVPFHSGLLDRVREFECGTASWHIEVAQFLKAPLGQEGATQFVADGYADVWLYEADDGELIGYACLGMTSWWLSTSPKKRKKNYTLPIVHFIGLRPHFWGRPEGPPEGRYAWLILEDVMAAAVEKLDRSQGPLRAVGGLVQAENGRALRFLERFGYQTLNPETTGYRKLIYPVG